MSQTTNMLAEIKIVSYMAVTGAFAWFNVPAEGFAILFGLIVLDTFLGAMRSMIVDARNFTSVALRNGFLSKVILVLLPLIVISVGKGIGMDLSTLASASIGILIASEGYSCVANIGQIIAKDANKPESDAVSFVISKILSVLKAVLDGFMKK